MDEWTIRFHPLAMREIYSMVRGPAAKISDFIDSLKGEPLPDGVKPVYKSNTVFQYVGDGFTVVYRFMDEEHAIRIIGVRELKLKE